jgi:hypothetical protein
VIHAPFTMNAQDFYLIGIFLAPVDCMPAEMMALEL